MIHFLLAPVYLWLAAVSLLITSYAMLLILDGILPNPRPKKKGE